MAPIKSSLVRTVGKLFGVSKDTDLSLRGHVQETRRLPFSASGGSAELTPGDGYKYHFFTSDDDFTCTQPVSVDYIVIAGGEHIHNIEFSISTNMVIDTGNSGGTGHGQFSNRRRRSISDMGGGMRSGSSSSSPILASELNSNQSSPTNKLFTSDILISCSLKRLSISL